MINLLSGVRLGSSLKLLPELRVYTLNKIMIYSQTAHLEQAAGRDLPPPECDAHRASFVRRILAREGVVNSDGGKQSRKPMNYNFTDRVRKVLAMAREEAIRLQHDYVGTEHILLGLIREGEGVAAAVLMKLTVDLDAIHEEVEESVRKGKATIALGELPYTSRAKKVLEYAMAEAREMSHSYVGTEHLLLGLLREEKGIAAQVLNSLGVTLEEARAETLKILGSDVGPPEPAGIGGVVPGSGDAHGQGRQEIQDSRAGSLLPGPHRSGPAGKARSNHWAPF